MGSKTAHKVDKSLLSKFWQLAESNQTKIIQASKALVDDIDRRQVDESEICEELQYSINRLVKGLASNRQSARHGFSVALCQILRTFTAVNVDMILGAVAEHLKFTQKESRSEQGNILLGKVLAYLTLVQSDRIASATQEHVQKIIQSLVQVCKNRAYLKQISTYAISLIVSQVNTDIFKASVWSEIEADLTQGWTGCSPDTLLLLLACQKYHPKMVDKAFLKTYWGSSVVFCVENLKHIWNVIKLSTSSYPVIHLINDEIIHQLTAAKMSFTDFWTEGRDLLFSKEHHSSVSVGLYLMTKMLPHLTTPKEIECLLPASVVRVLVKVIDGKQKKTNPVHQAATQFMNGLVTYVKSSENTDNSIKVLHCFHETQCPKGANLTRSLETIIQSLCTEAAKQYGENLMKVFKKYAKDPKENMVGIQHVATQVRILVTLPSTSDDHTWQLRLLQFLGLHSFWTVQAKSSEIPHCSFSTRPMEEKLRKAFQDNFYKALNNLLSYNTEKSKTSSLDVYLDTACQLCKYFQDLIEATEFVTPVLSLSEDETEQWVKTVLCLMGMQEKNAANSPERLDLYRAFVLLFVFHALHLFVSKENAVSASQDIHICYNKAVKHKRRSTVKSAKSEPEWIEVVTELLLSMMSQGSSFARLAAKTTFGCLTDHVTPDSLGLITDVLKTEKGDESVPISFEDEEEDIIEDVSDMENENGENGLETLEAEEEKEEGTDEEESSEEDSDEEEEEGEEVNEEFRNAVKSALGEAAEKSDSEEESEPDLDDETMFKLDGALVQVFKNMRKTKEAEAKENKKQLLAFKSRVLDLVEILVKSQPPADLTLDLIFPLLELLASTEKHKEGVEVDLGKRAGNIFRILYRKAKIHGNMAVSRDRYLEAMNNAIQFSTKVTTKQIVNDVSDACLLVIRLLMNLEMGSLGPSPMKTRSKKNQKEKEKREEKERDQETVHHMVIDIIQSNLRDFLQKKKQKLHREFFYNMFSKFPVLFWPVTETLLNTIQDDQVKVFIKTQACYLLSGMLNKDVEKTLGEEAWKEFSLSLIAGISRILRLVSKEAFPTKLVHDVCVTLRKYLNCSQKPQEVPEEVTEKLESLRGSFNTDIRKEYLGIMSKLGKTTPNMNQNKNARKRKNKDRTGTAGQNAENKKVKTSETETVTSPVVNKKTKKRKQNSLSEKVKGGPKTKGSESDLETSKNDSNSGLSIQEDGKKSKKKKVHNKEKIVAE
ncbi:myb-binding protein 1A-like protein [Saccostrea echinata]|uniref:myb-binding protein 1A-like protein n=1 Tax=Saccostrea echinata TaxID=191078 RepID=UPI002A83122B|nr:myb-binding protein 1A-like protein [Saccostrea echinata]